MMKLLIFSVHDKAVNAFVQPFYARARGEAIRSFMEAVNTESHQFHKHALDYTLMYLGEYDDGNGTFVSVEPQRVMSAVECLDDPFTEEKRINDPGDASPRRMM